MERSHNIYFFALNLENQDPNFEMIPIRQKILYEIFQDLQPVEALRETIDRTRKTGKK